MELDNGCFSVEEGHGIGDWPVAPVRRWRWTCDAVAWGCWTELVGNGAERMEHLLEFVENGVENDPFWRNGS
jgi:hypothetical protein